MWRCRTGTHGVTDLALRTRGEQRACFDDVAQSSRTSEMSIAGI